MTRTKAVHKHSSNCRQEQLSHTIYYELFSCNTYRDIALKVCPNWHPRPEFAVQVLSLNRLKLNSKYRS